MGRHHPHAVGEEPHSTNVENSNEEKKALFSNDRMDHFIIHNYIYTPSVYIYAYMTYECDRMSNHNYYFCILRRL